MESIQGHRPSSTAQEATNPGAGGGRWAASRALFGLVSGGHAGLGWYVQGAPSITKLDADGQRRPAVITSEVDDGASWRPAREQVAAVGGGRELRPRILTPQILAAHLRGGYSVATEAPGWLAWVAVDIDAHAKPDDGAEGKRAAVARARGVLGQVLAALGCGGERWPVILQSPGGGFHVWIPLGREGSADHRWPAAWAAHWFRHHFAACGIELRDGVCEVFPSGRRLRAPCGRGSLLLRVVREDVTDPLALEPVAGTYTTRERWLSHGDVVRVRKVDAMAWAFLRGFEAQRRTIAEWTGRPEAAWDPCWGFLERPSGEGRAKKTGPGVPRTYAGSQQPDDVSDRPPGGGTLGDPKGRGGPALVVVRGGGAVGDQGDRVPDPLTSFCKTSLGTDAASHPGPGESEGDTDASAGPLLKGRAYWRKVGRLLAEGVTLPASRHDAVLVLTFAWAAPGGCSDGETIDRLIAWCSAHAHAGSRLAGSPLFTKECIREAWHYLKHYGPHWRRRSAARAAGRAVSLGVLTEADRRGVLDLVDARVRTEAETVLSFLAGRADERGAVADPVEWASGLASKLLGDRRVVDGDGARRRAVVVAVAELARLGVITRYRGHWVGHAGRRWSVWYRFGSGALPVAVRVLRSAWDRAGQREALVPSLYTFTRPGDGAPHAPGAAEGEAVEVREVGARRVPGGVLRALSDAGAVRVLFEVDPDSGPARPGARAAWWLRQWRGRPPSVGEFFHAIEGAMVARVAERIARMARRPRDGAELAAVPANGNAAAPAAVADAGSYDPPAAPGQGGAVELYAPPLGVASVAVPELAGLELAPDLAAVLGGAWSSWAARRRPE
jgi:hypothetical protein